MNKTFEEKWYKRLREYIQEDVWIDLVESYKKEDEEE